MLEQGGIYAVANLRGGGEYESSGTLPVALPEVGVLDMLRYHRFTSGAGWPFDYGTVEESKKMFEYLCRYSPLHAIRAA